MDQQKRLAYALAAAFIGLSILARFIPFLVLVIFASAVAFGVVLLNHFYLAPKRRLKYEVEKAALTENLAAGTGELVIRDDGFLTLTFQNKTNQPLRIHPSVRLHYTHVGGTPSSKSVDQKAIAILTRTLRKEPINPGASYCFEMLDARSRFVPLPRDEYLYHPELMPFLEESAGVLALVTEQPDIYTLHCTIHFSDIMVTRVFNPDTSP